MSLFAVAGLPLGGCGGGGGSDAGSDAKNTGGTPPATIAGSCSNAVSGFCNEFSGSSYRAATVQRTCERQGLMFLSGACPSEGRVGTCLVYKGQGSESSYRYYSGFPGSGSVPTGGAAAAAEDQCTRALKGQWTPN